MFPIQHLLQPDHPGRGSLHWRTLLKDSSSLRTKWAFSWFFQPRDVVHFCVLWAYEALWDSLVIEGLDTIRPQPYWESLAHDSVEDLWQWTTVYLIYSAVWTLPWQQVCAVGWSHSPVCRWWPGRRSWGPGGRVWSWWGLRCSEWRRPACCLRQRHVPLRAGCPSTPACPQGPSPEQFQLVFGFW